MNSFSNINLMIPRIIFSSVSTVHYDKHIKFLDDKVHVGTYYFDNDKKVFRFYLSSNFYRYRFDCDDNLNIRIFRKGGDEIIRFEIVGNTKTILERIKKYKPGNCVICGRLDKVHWHHIGNKKNSIVNMVYNLNYSDNDIENEIKKCVPVCIYCHLEIHRRKRK